jgi:CelD/BcsL family acetyltransferase involved in cellulose biosynthesis
VNIDVLVTEEDFLLLKDDWNRLNESSDTGNIFLSWEWQYRWWQNYARTSRLLIMVVRENTTITAILPLYIKKEYIFRVVPVYKLCMLGTGGDTSPDYMDLITCNSETTQMQNELIDKIFSYKADWDCIDFSNLQTHIGFADALAQRCRINNIPEMIRMDSRIPYIQLKDGWDEYLATLSSNRRAQIRRDRRKFERMTDAKFLTIENKSDLDFAINKLIRLHHKRWIGRGEDYAFSSPEYISFHYQVIEDLFDKDMIRMSCLELGGEIIAMLYCYKWNDKYYYFQGGFDTDYADIKPGSVLMAYTIEKAINEGMSVFDMLKGDYNFKRSLAKHYNTTWKLTVFKRSLPGMLSYFKNEVMPYYKTRLKNMIVSGRAKSAKILVDH